MLSFQEGVFLVTTLFAARTPNGFFEYFCIRYPYNDILKMQETLFDTKWQNNEHTPSEITSTHLCQWWYLIIIIKHNIQWWHRSFLFLEICNKLLIYNLRVEVFGYDWVLGTFLEHLSIVLFNLRVQSWENQQKSSTFLADCFPVW